MTTGKPVGQEKQKEVNVVKGTRNAKEKACISLLGRPKKKTSGGKEEAHARQKKCLKQVEKHKTHPKIIRKS